WSQAEFQKSSWSAANQSPEYQTGTTCERPLTGRQFEKTYIGLRPEAALRLFKVQASNWHERICQMRTTSPKPDAGLLLFQ
ncbi:MAG: hypothetical protein WCH35_17950, partial [Comamonadaceae bacterium]